MGNDKATLRRYEDDLYVSGTGIMIMGLWTVVKLTMELFLGPEVKNALEAEDPASRATVMIIIVILATVLLMFVLVIHMYIGLNAVRAAKGRPYKKGYYYMAYAALVLTVAGLFTYVDSFKDPKKIDTDLASLIVDLTTIYIFASAIISTKKIKKLKEELLRENCG